MKSIIMPYVRQEIKKHLSPFLYHSTLGADSMDNGTNLCLLKEDKLVLREVNTEFWKRCENLEILNMVVVHSYEHNLSGIIKHTQGSKTFLLHRLNSTFEDVEFHLSTVKRIYVIEYASREHTLN